MKVIISPAKSIDLTKEVPFDKHTNIVFLKEATSLAGKLKKLSAKKIKTMMHISDELAELNHSRFQKWEEPIKSTEDIRQAIYAFNGEVYRGFDAYSLTEQQLEVSQEKLRILSGLYGLLKPLDLIFPYRLEMGTKWDITPKQKNLYQFWGKKLSENLNTEMDEGEVLINLASAEYSKAIDTKALKAKMITPIFKEFKNGEYKIIMTFAKKARGMMARWIINNNVSDPDQLKTFDEDGYQYADNLSNSEEWVFIR